MHANKYSAIVHRVTLAMTLALLTVPAGAGQIRLPANGAAASMPTMTAPDPATQARIRNTLGKMPLHFEVNSGQTDAQVKFLSRTGGYALFLTPTEAVLTLAAGKDKKPRHAGESRHPDDVNFADISQNLDSGVRRNDELNEEAPVEDKDTKTGTSVLRLRWLNANPDPKVIGAAPQPGKSAYFHGSDAARWRSNVAHYGKVQYEAVYPGIDLVYYGNQNRIEYDFVVQPGTDPDQIRLAIDGAQNIRLDADGNLILVTAHGDLLQQAPVIYQEIDGERVAVEGRYVLHENNEIGFQVAAYDQDRTLVIDPILQSTYLGGSANDFIKALAIHPVSGDVYVAGYTASSDFPGIAGGADTVFGGTQEAFVARLNSALTSLVQATFLGGSGNSDLANAIAIHPVTGDVYVAGDTRSSDFPGITGGADTTFVGAWEAFVVRLNSTLTSLTQATFLGGSGGDFGNALAIHPVSGDVYVAGYTDSSDFPGIAGGADATLGGFQDAFVVRLNSALTSLTQATFLGGSGTDFGNALAIHPVSGDVYVAGSAAVASIDFPGIAGGADTTIAGDECFVARLNSALTSLTQATFLGGSSNDYPNSLAIHPVSGDVYMAGYTNSSDFPGIAGGADTTFGGTSEAFVARLSSALTSLTQATFLGGSVFEIARSIAIHPVSGDVYVAGYTTSPDFPSIAGGADTTISNDEGFVARLNSALTSLTQATYLGGIGNESASVIAIHPVNGNVYVAGDIAFDGLPGIAGGADTTLSGWEGFITRLTADLAAVSASADLSITLTDAPDPVAVGGTLTYTATITNNGPDAASGVAFTDTLPAVTFVSVSATQGSCAQSLGVVSCSIGALANAASATVTMVVTPTAAGALSNTASVTATESDPSAANNSAIAATTVTAVAGGQTVCSNSLQALASNLVGAQAANCSVNVGPGSANGGGGAFDPFLLAGLALLYLGRYRRRNRLLPGKIGRELK